MVMIKILVLISILVGATHLISKDMTSDMSLGFAMGLVWSIFLMIIIGMVS